MQYFIIAIIFDVN